MDIDPEGELSHHEQVPPLAPEAGKVTVPTTTVTAPRARIRRRYVLFALVGVLTIGVGLAAFFAVREGVPPSTRWRLLYGFVANQIRRHHHVNQGDGGWRHHDRHL